MSSDYMWCFFKNEPCSKQGEFSYPWVTSSKKVFYSFTTKKGIAHNKAIKEDIRKILESHGYELITFEEEPIPSTAYYCETICRLIHESAFVIADISCLGSANEIIFSPNVMLEIGIAAGYGIPIIIVMDKGIKSIAEGIPSNLQGVQIMAYDTDFGKNGRFENTIIRLTNKLLDIPNFKSIKSFEESNTFQERLESITSHRYFLGRYPLSIMRSRKMTTQRAKVLQSGKIDTKEDIEQYLERVEKRRKGLKKILDNQDYECFEIYTKETFLDYFKKGAVRDHKNPESEIEERFKTLRKYFSKENYHIGLLEGSAPHYFLAKKRYGLIIYSGTRRYKGVTGEIIASQRNVVDEYVTLHEVIWKEINEEDKDKKKILKQMEKAFNYHSKKK